MKPIQVSREEDYEDNPSGSQTPGSRPISSGINSAFRNITGLLKILDEKSMIDDMMVYNTHAAVDKGLNKLSEHRMDLLNDLNAIVESFRAGMMTPEQLEAMIKTEHQRSKFILKMAATIGKHLETLFDMFQNMTDHQDNPTLSPLPPGYMNTVNAQMQVVFESVDSISKVIAAPGSQLNQVVAAAEKGIEKAEILLNTTQAAHEKAATEAKNERMKRLAHEAESASMRSSASGYAGAGKRTPTVSKECQTDDSLFAPMREEMSRISAMHAQMRARQGQGMDPSFGGIPGSASYGVDGDVNVVLDSPPQRKRGSAAISPSRKNGGGQKMNSARSPKSSGAANVSGSNTPPPIVSPNAMSQRSLQSFGSQKSVQSLQSVSDLVRNDSLDKGQIEVVAPVEDMLPKKSPDTPAIRRASLQKPAPKSKKGGKAPERRDSRPNTSQITSAGPGAAPSSSKSESKINTSGKMVANAPKTPLGQALPIQHAEPVSKQPDPDAYAHLHPGTVASPTSTLSNRFLTKSRSGSPSGFTDADELRPTSSSGHKILKVDSKTDNESAAKSAHAKEMAALAAKLANETEKVKTEKEARKALEEVEKTQGKTIEQLNTKVSELEKDLRDAKAHSRPRYSTDTLSSPRRSNLTTPRKSIEVVSLSSTEIPDVKEAQAKLSAPNDADPTQWGFLDGEKMSSQRGFSRTESRKGLRLTQAPSMRNIAGVKFDEDYLETVQREHSGKTDSRPGTTSLNKQVFDQVLASRSQKRRITRESSTNSDNGYGGGMSPSRGTLPTLEDFPYAEVSPGMSHSAGRQGTSEKPESVEAGVGLGVGEAASGQTTSANKTSFAAMAAIAALSPRLRKLREKRQSQEVANLADEKTILPVESSAGNKSSAPPSNFVYFPRMGPPHVDRSSSTDEVPFTLCARTIEYLKNQYGINVPAMTGLSLSVPMAAVGVQDNSVSSAASPTSQVSHITAGVSMASLGTGVDMSQTINEIHSINAPSPPLLELSQGSVKEHQFHSDTMNGGGKDSFVDAATVTKLTPSIVQYERTPSTAAQTNRTQMDPSRPNTGVGMQSAMMETRHKDISSGKDHGVGSATLNVDSSTGTPSFGPGAMDSMYFVDAGSNARTASAGQSISAAGVLRPVGVNSVGVGSDFNMISGSDTKIHVGANVAGSHYPTIGGQSTTKLGQIAENYSRELQQLSHSSSSRGATASRQGVNPSLRSSSRSPTRSDSPSRSVGLQDPESTSPHHPEFKSLKIVSKGFQSIVQQEGQVVAEPKPLVFVPFDESQRDNLKYKLATAENPLMNLVDEFQDALPDFWKTRLMTAASGYVAPAKVNAPERSNTYTVVPAEELRYDLSSPLPRTVAPSGLQEPRKQASKSNGIPTNVSKYFGFCLSTQKKLEKVSTKAVAEIMKAENLAHGLIALLRDRSCEETIYKRSLQEIYKKFGELEAVKFYVEVQMGEFRSILDGMNALDISLMPHLRRHCSEFKEFYAAFLSTQGKMVDMTNRAIALKTHCTSIHLSSAENWPKLDLRNLTLAMPVLKHGGLTSREPGPADGQLMNEKELKEMMDLIEMQEERLDEARETIHELEVSLVNAVNKHDHTPGALLFYSILDDKQTVPTLESLIRRLHSLEGFATGTQHADVKEIRTKLMECIRLTPVVNKLTKRYAGLHKSYLKRRLETFTARAQTGGDADGMYTCPMCSSDTRVLAGPTHDPVFSIDRLDTTSKLRQLTAGKSPASIRRPRSGRLNSSRGLKGFIQMELNEDDHSVGSASESLDYESTVRSQLSQGSHSSGASRANRTTQSEDQLSLKSRNSVIV